MKTWCTACASIVEKGDKMISNQILEPLEPIELSGEIQEFITKISDSCGVPRQTLIYLCWSVYREGQACEADKITKKMKEINDEYKL